MFKIVAVVVALTSHGLEPTGVAFKWNKVSFENKDACEKLLAKPSDELKKDMAAVDGAVKKASTESKIKVKVLYECQKVEPPAPPKEDRNV